MDGLQRVDPEISRRPTSTVLVVATVTGSPTSDRPEI